MQTLKRKVIYRLLSLLACISLAYY